jgi:hypothetical protein
MDDGRVDHGMGVKGILGKRKRSGRRKKESRAWQGLVSWSPRLAGALLGLRGKKKRRGVPRGGRTEPLLLLILLWDSRFINLLAHSFSSSALHACLGATWSAPAVA